MTLPPWIEESSGAVGDEILSVMCLNLGPLSLWEVLLFVGVFFYPLPEKGG